MQYKLSSGLLCLLTAALMRINCYAQNNSNTTRLYKRVSIVQNGSKKTTNDDAHFITFTKNGFYVSDSNGNTLGGNLIKFIKNENNLHCYSGVINGANTDVFFSNDYSRINIRYGDRTDVYQRELGKTTTASMRVNGGNGNSRDYYLPPVQMSITPNTSSGTSTISPRQCQNCHGTGRDGDEIIYRTDYTGRQADEYCSICGRWGSPHSHRTKMCRVCYGKGTIE